jgi:CTP:molybdopterin cytidylyltransferase MocA
MIERVITALRNGGADPIVVVTGAHDPALPTIARAAGAEICELTNPTPQMRATVEYGLSWLQEHHDPRTDDAFLLTPGDIPFLSAVTVRVLCEAWQRRPAVSILVPTHAGRRGHPALIGWRHVENIRTLPIDVGVDAYLREKISESAEVELPIDVAADWDAPDDIQTPTAGSNLPVTSPKPTR